MGEGQEDGVVSRSLGREPTANGKDGVDGTNGEVANVTRLVLPRQRLEIVLGELQDIFNGCCTGRLEGSAMWGLRVASVQN